MLGSSGAREQQRVGTEGGRGDSSILQRGVYPRSTVCEPPSHIMCRGLPPHLVSLRVKMMKLRGVLAVSCFLSMVSLGASFFHTSGHRPPTPAERRNGCLDVRSCKSCTTTAIAAATGGAGTEDSVSLCFEPSGIEVGGGDTGCMWPTKHLILRNCFMRSSSCLDYRAVSEQQQQSSRVHRE